MRTVNRRSALSIAGLAMCALFSAHGSALCVEAGAVSDSSGSVRWGGTYTGLIRLDENPSYFPWNDKAAHSHLTDRVSLMFDARSARYLHFFIKGTTGLRVPALDEDVYSSRFFIDQGHLSAKWKGRLKGKLFLRERVFRNRGRLMQTVSNDSRLVSGRGEGFDAEVRAAGSVLLAYTCAVFRNPVEQKRDFGLPPLPLSGRFLNLFEGGIDRRSWHAGMTIADGGLSWLEGDYLALYGLDAGFGLAGGTVNIEFARSARDWEDFEDGLFGLDAGAMEWGGFSAGLPSDGVLAAEWTGLELDAGGKGKFGLTPGYRYSGEGYIDRIGEVSSGHVESYAELWWKHAGLAMLTSLKAADRYDYRTGEGGGVLSASFWTRLRGGLETTARAFFAEGSRPVLVISTVDDNSLTRLVTTARFDDAGGGSEFSFLTEAGVNLGRRWTLGGSIYLERSVRGFYSADIEMRGGNRFVFRASAGTYVPVSTYADLNYDPALQATGRDKSISFQTRIWLGGI